MTVTVNRYTSNYLEGMNYKNKVNEINNDLQKISEKVQTGQKYKQYYEVDRAAEAKEIISTSDAVKKTKATSDSLGVVLDRLEFSSQKMGMIIDRVTKSISDIVKTANSQGDEFIQLKNQAGEMLSSLRSALNSKSNTDGSYFFSGNAVTTQPVGVDLVGIKDRKDSKDSKLPYYSGGTESLTYVYKDQLEHYGITADEPAFQGLIKAYQELYHDPRNLELSEFRGLVQDAKSKIILLREKIGEQATKVKVLKDSADKELLDLKEKRSQFLESDPTEEIVKMGKSIARLNAIAYTNKTMQENSVLNIIGK